MARVEIRHSNFLAWLLDPSETHGYGPLFLRAMLADFAARARTGCVQSAVEPPVDLDGDVVEVRREWSNIDVLVVCRQPGLVIAIENKIDAREHGDQLERYAEKLRRAFPPARYQHLLIYVTPGTATPSCEGWIAYGYRDLHRVLTACLESRQADTSEVDVVLTHYLRLIGSWYMTDPETDRLCREIYRKHRQAFDLILARIKEAPPGLLDQLVRTLTARGDLYVFRHMAEVTFTPLAWLDRLPPILDKRGKPDWTDLDERAWVAMYYTLDKGELRWHFWLGPATNTRVREHVLRLLSRLLNAGLSAKQNAEDVDLADELVLSLTDAAAFEPQAMERVVSAHLAATLERLTEVPASLASAGVLGTASRTAQQRRKRKRG